MYTAKARCSLRLSLNLPRLPKPLPCALTLEHNYKNDDHSSGAAREEVPEPSQNGANDGFANSGTDRYNDFGTL